MGALIGNRTFFVQLRGSCAAEHRSYHITGGIPVEQELAIHS
jgi:hypothetical protein